MFLRRRIGPGDLFLSKSIRIPEITTFAKGIGGIPPHQPHHLVRVYGALARVRRLGLGGLGFILRSKSISSFRGVICHLSASAGRYLFNTLLYGYPTKLWRVRKRKRRRCSSKWSQVLVRDSSMCKKETRKITQTKENLSSTIRSSNNVSYSPNKNLSKLPVVFG